MKKIFTILFSLMMVFFLVSGASADSNSAATAGAGAEAKLGDVNSNNIHNYNYEAGNIPTPLPNGVDANYPPLTNFFGPDSPPWNFQTIEDIVQFKMEWKRWELAPHVSHTKMRERIRYLIRRDKSRLTNPNEHIKIFVGGVDTTKVKVLAFMHLKADNTDTTSFELMVKAALRGLDVRAEGIGIMRQGCMKLVKSGAKGIGFNHSTATMNNAGDVGTISSGGFGVSKGEAGNHGKPWIQVVAFDFIK